MSAGHGSWPSTSTACRRGDGGMSQGEGRFPEIPGSAGSKLKTRSEPTATNEPNFNIYELPLRSDETKSRSVRSDPLHDSVFTISNLHSLGSQSDTAVRSAQMSDDMDINIPIPPPPWIPPPPESSQRGTPKSLPNDASLFELQSFTEVQESSRHSEISQNVEVQTKVTFEAEKERIRRLRLECWSSRRQVHGLRIQLRSKERGKSIADDRLLQRLSRQEFGLFDENEIIIGKAKSNAELLQDCREARGEYGPLEDDCNRLEDELSQREYDLTKLEEIFYARWSGSVFSNPTLSTKVDGESGENLQFPPTASIAFDIEEIPLEHPLVTSYLSKLGDLDILQERFFEIEEGRALLGEGEESRRQFGRNLAPSDQAWLDSSESTLAKLSKEIEVLGKDVNKLRQECFAKMLVDDTGEPTNFQLQERTYFQDEDLTTNGHSSEYVKYPTLLPRSGFNLSPLKLEGRESKQKPGSLGGRVNHWILGQLRDSPLEVKLLESTAEKVVGNTDGGWEVAVLELWNDDETIDAEEYESTTSDKTAELLLRSNHSSASSHNYDFQGRKNVYCELIFAPEQTFDGSEDHAALEVQ